MNDKIQAGAGKVLPFAVSKPLYEESKRTASGSYRQPWSVYNEAQTNELEHFQRLLWHLCQLPERPMQ